MFDGVSVSISLESYWFCGFIMVCGLVRINQREMWLTIFLANSHVNNHGYQ